MKGKQTLKKKKTNKDMEKRDKLGRFVNGNKSRLGKKHSKKTKKKISETNKRKGIMPPLIRPGHSEETKKKFSEMRKDTQIGEKNNAWKGGITPINKRIRRSHEYKLWREAVFKRDKFTCRFCGQVGGKLNADHIKPFALFLELRFAIDNGRTLCEDCHRKTDTYGGRTK